MDKFVNWLKFQVRKFLISIKRNFYVVPLVLIAVCCTYFMCNLYILSPGFARISGNDAGDVKSYTAIFTFVVSLLSILSTVAYLNFALKKYGEKKPIAMVVIYLVMTVINIVLLFLILDANNQSVAQDYAKMINPETDEAAKKICEEFVTLGNKCKGIVIAQIVLEFISLILVIVAPFIQAQLKKLKFKAINLAEEKELGEKANG